MSRRKPLGLAENGPKHLARVRERYPDKRSVCGALLESITKDPDPDDRIHSAINFGLFGYRRGLNKLEVVIDGLEGQLATGQCEDYGSWQRSLFSQLMFALGRMDTKESHALLVRLLNRSSSPMVRADVLEGMAFEKESFEWEVVLNALSPSASPDELASALYALEFHSYAVKRPDDARKRLAPFLAHTSGWVRSYTVQALMYDSTNRDLILAMKDDPDSQVTNQVTEAIQLMDMLDQEAP